MNSTVMLTSSAWTALRLNVVGVPRSALAAGSPRSEVATQCGNEASETHRSVFQLVGLKECGPTPNTVPSRTVETVPKESALQWASVRESPEPPPDHRLF